MIFTNLPANKRIYDKQLHISMRKLQRLQQEHAWGGPPADCGLVVNLIKDRAVSMVTDTSGSNIDWLLSGQSHEWLTTQAELAAKNSTRPTDEA